MANIPNSSRYQSSGSRTSANAGVTVRSWAEQKDSKARNVNIHQSAKMDWLWGLAATGLLIAFPYHVLCVIGLYFFISWLFGKK